MNMNEEDTTLAELAVGYLERIANALERIANATDEAVDDGVMVRQQGIWRTLGVGQP